MRVNDTAYKVEVLRYNGPESMRRYLEGQIEHLKNLTGGLVLVRGSPNSTSCPIHVMDRPRKVRSGKEAAAKMMETTGKLCSMGSSREDINKRQELLRKLYEENTEGMRVLEATFRALQSGILYHDLVAAGLDEETKYICNGGFSVSVDELKGYIHI